MRNVCNIAVGEPEVKNHLKDLGIDGRMILERILTELDSYSSG
jgi:hypothetical protein